MEREIGIEPTTFSLGSGRNEGLHSDGPVGFGPFWADQVRQDYVTDFAR
jgi:hypothetical protein